MLASAYMEFAAQLTCRRERHSWIILNVVCSHMRSRFVRSDAMADKRPGSLFAHVPPTALPPAPPMRGRVSISYPLLLSRSGARKISSLDCGTAKGVLK
jgi:hypothetical protein